MMTPLGVCGGVQEMDTFNEQETDDMMTTGPGTEKRLVNLYQNEGRTTHNIQLFDLLLDYYTVPHVSSYSLQLL